MIDNNDENEEEIGKLHKGKRTKITKSKIVHN